MKILKPQTLTPQTLQVPTGLPLQQRVLSGVGLSERCCCSKFHEMAFEPRFGVGLKEAVLTEAVLTYLLNLVIIYSMRTSFCWPEFACSQAQSATCPVCHLPCLQSCPVCNMPCLQHALAAIIPCLQSCPVCNIPWLAFLQVACKQWHAETSDSVAAGCRQ